MAKVAIGVGDFKKEDADRIIASTKNPSKAISEMAKLAGISYWEMKQRIADERQRKYEAAQAKLQPKKEVPVVNDEDTKKLLDGLSEEQQAEVKKLLNVEKLESIPADIVAVNSDLISN